MKRNIPQVVDPNQLASAAKLLISMSAYNRRAHKSNEGVQTLWGAYESALDNYVASVTMR